MPVYDQGYRSYEARAPLRRFRAWPILRESLAGSWPGSWAGGLLAVPRQIAFFGLLLLPWVVAVGGLIYLYVLGQVRELGDRVPNGAVIFGYYLWVVSIFPFLATVFVGAGSIAEDLRSGGILLYLSRPLTRRDYVLGKLGGLVVVQLVVTLLPALLLYGGALAVLPARFAKWELAWIAPALVAQSLLAACAYGLVALALSALTRSTRVAGLAFFGGLTVLHILALLGVQLTHRPEAALLSVTAQLGVVRDALFGIPAAQPSLPWPLALLGLAAIGAGCVWILARRVRAVEVVT